mgnify:CR=1 FL=1
MLCALRTGAKEFKFVVEVLIAGLGADFVLKVMHRAENFSRLRSGDSHIELHFGMMVELTLAILIHE